MRTREPLTLRDGTRLSVQASGGHYCSPRKDEAEWYSAVEVGADKPTHAFAKWADGSNGAGGTYVYAWVPAHVVLNYIEAHGGVRRGQMPPMRAAVIASRD